MFIPQSYGENHERRNKSLFIKYLLLQFQNLPAHLIDS